MVSPKIPYGGFSPVRLKGWNFGRGLPPMRGLPSPFVRAAAIAIPCSVSGTVGQHHTSMRAVFRSTPGSSLRPGYSVPALSAYLTPCAPLAGASRLHRLAVYTRCPRCAENDPRPRQPTSGSELSLMLCRNMSSSVTAGNSLAALAQLLRREHWPSTPKKRLGIPFILTLRSW